MRVAQVSTFDVHGGAAIAAHRLHHALRDSGVDSTMVVAEKRSGEQQIVSVMDGLPRKYLRLIARLDRLPVSRLRHPYGKIMTPGWIPSGAGGRINRLNFDLLNLHWVNGGFLSVVEIARLKRPIVWTLHDMWAICGAEHYDCGSGRFRSGYLDGNQPDSETGWDINRWVWSLKRRKWSGLKDVVFVTPSRWLGKCVSESALFAGNRVEVIPNGVDESFYSPADKAAARTRWGLPLGKKLILFGAMAATSEPRKGFQELSSALAHLSADVNSNGIELVVFGGRERKTGMVANMTSHFVGSVNDQKGIVDLYSCADVFVAPSLQDNLPNTVLEAMACAVPVVAFNIGGMPDMIRHQQNGYLADYRSPMSLAEGLRWVLDDPVRYRAMSVSARETVLTGFTGKLQATRYADLYGEILERRGRQ